MIAVLPLASDPNPLLKWSYVTGQWSDIQDDLVTHFQLTVSAVALGLVLSSVLAAIALRYRWTMNPITGFTGFLFTLPSVALFGVLVPVTGYTKLTALVPLTLYTLLILVTNIVAGFQAVPRSVREAADGMGLTPARRVLTVELPLAMPYVITGIRVATVTTVGLVTVAAIIGQGALGDLILDGLKRTYWTPMTVGAVLSVALALVLDLGIYLIGRAAAPWTRRGRAGA